MLDGANSGGAAGPEIAVLPVLPPPRLIAVDHRAAAHLVLERLHHRRCVPPHPVEDFADLSHVQRQPVEGFSLPLNRAGGEAARFSQGRDQGHRRRAHPMLPNDLVPELRFGGTLLVADQTLPRHKAMVDDLDRDDRDVENLAGPFHRAAEQGRPIDWALLVSVFDDAGGGSRVCGQR